MASPKGGQPPSLPSCLSVCLVACPRELFSSLVPQTDSGPAFWCLCPGLNADRTPPRTGHHSWVWARGFESSHFFHTHTFSVREGCAPEGPRVWLEAKISPRKGSVSSSGARLTVSTPSRAAGPGLRAGETKALHPSRALASLPGRPGAPCCLSPRSLARDPGVPTPGVSLPRAPRLHSQCVSRPALGSLWPRCPVERVQAWRTETDRGLSGASPRSDGTMGELCSQTARPYKSCPASAAKNSPSSELCLCPSSQDVVFPGGASSLLGLRVFKTVSLAARAPSSPEWGRLLLSPSHTWTDGDLLPSHTLPLQRSLRSLTLQEHELDRGSRWLEFGPD